MGTADDAAVAIFLEGNNCAQSVLAACGEPLGLPRTTAMQVAQAFGGGLGRTGHVCGAVTGALMALGLKVSAKDGKDNATKERAYKLAQELMDRFRKHHGTINCRDLIRFELNTPEGYQRAAEAGVFRTICPGLVRDAAQIVQQLLPKA